MDESEPSSFPASHHADASQNASTSTGTQGRAGGTGLKLVLPPLQAVRAMKGSGGKKRKGSGANLSALEPEPKREKIPRPIKLKPLREVLTKLITQIKK